MKLIDKDTLVAEIEKLRDKAYPNSDWNHGYVASCEKILSLIDTIEVKDVDLEKEDAVHGTVDYPLIGYDFPNIYPNYKELKEYCDKKGIKDNDKVKLIIIKAQKGEEV